MAEELKHNPEKCSCVRSGHSAMSVDGRYAPMVAAFGKELKVDGVRWADCTSNERADIIRRALENFFRKPSLPDG